ncbi:polymer-forming cytoskeletal protein [Chengkuizengella sp. YPA3-1-1]|uniref:Polymer-forming cytoskeletal protein n=2 Tax=Chengkuizengella marina TaxID=2507566 RepID=A0A6N9PZP6_9BACL|nr:polymer-forming cytoskeletal protein [Chengkuizengella marina]
MDPNKTDTLIGEGSYFDGNIKSEASIRIDGKIVGDIHCEGDVIIGENGVAVSNITARNTTVVGKIEGNVETKKLQISSTGKVHGNISISILSIEDGGKFEGSSKMIADQSTTDIQSEIKQDKKKNVPA